jgi:hypothetical protein
MDGRECKGAAERTSRTFSLFLAREADLNKEHWLICSH